jgi:Ca2+-binding RTX toxin-like protein
VIAGNAASNVLNGAGGTDTVSYYGATQGVTVDLYGGGAIDGGLFDTLLNFENVNGSGFNDVIAGNGASNVLDGGGGTDTVNYFGSAHGVTVDLYFGGAVDGAAFDTLLNFENVDGSVSSDVIAGNAGSNVLNGSFGIDTLSYYGAAQGVTVNLSSGLATEGASTDTLVSLENVDGSAFGDTIIGDGGANVLDGAGGGDSVTGGGGNDTFVFKRGQVSGDAVVDFSGNGAAAGDQLQFFGYGSATDGATFTQIDATHWSINSADGTAHDVLTIANGAPVHASDVLFV